MEKDKAYVEHILGAIADIEKFTIGFDRERFVNPENKLVQNAVIRSFEVIGEAMKNLSEKIKNEHPDLPWRDITGMRNKLIHDYFSVNLGVVWKTVERDLSVLKNTMKVLEDHVV